MIIFFRQTFHTFIGITRFHDFQWCLSIHPDLFCFGDPAAIRIISICTAEQWIWHSRKDCLHPRQLASLIVCIRSPQAIAIQHFRLHIVSIIPVLCTDAIWGTHFCKSSCFIVAIWRFLFTCDKFSQTATCIIMVFIKRLSPCPFAKDSSLCIMASRSCQSLLHFVRVTAFWVESLTYLI